MERMRGEIQTPTDDQNGDCEALVASIRDTIGRFIMRVAYGHIVVENDPLLAIANEVVVFLIIGFSKHYWVNDFPIRKFFPIVLC